MTFVRPPLVLLLTLLFLLGCDGTGDSQKKRKGLYKDRDWCYGDEPSCGEATWTGACSDGQRQSPIDFPDMDTLPAKRVLKGFDKSMFNIRNYRLENTENSLEISPLGNFVPEKYFRHLRATYVFSNAHFHFGSDASRGSEHTISGKQFAGEMHFLLYKNNFPSLTAALKDRKTNDAVLAIGVFLNEGEDSRLFDDLVIHIPNDPGIIDVKDSIRFDQVFQGDMAYVYAGSSGVPPCYENVNYFVFRKPVYASRRFFDALRNMKDGRGGAVSDNFKKPVPKKAHQLSVVQIKYKGERYSVEEEDEREERKKMEMMESDEDGQNNNNNNNNQRSGEDDDDDRGKKSNSRNKNSKGKKKQKDNSEESEEGSKKKGSSGGRKSAWWWAFSKTFSS